MSAIAEVASMMNAILIFCGGVELFTYRIWLKFLPRWRSTILQLTKATSGYLIMSLCCTIFGLLDIDAQDVTTVTSNLGNWLSPIFAVMLSVLYGWFLVYSPDFMTIVTVVFWLAVTTANVIVSSLDEYTFGYHIWKAELRNDGASFEKKVLQRGLYDGAVFFAAVVIFALLMCVRVIFQNWERVSLVPLAATAIVSGFLRMPIFLLPTASDRMVPGIAIAYNSYNKGDAGHVAELLAWTSCFFTGHLIHVLFTDMKKNKLSTEAVNLDNPNGAQNDLVQRLLYQDTTDAVDREGLYSSKFPGIATMGEATGDVKRFQDLIPKAQASYTGGILEQGGQLSDEQVQILEICKTDEEQRDRILFGGGLW